MAAAEVLLVGGRYDRVRVALTETPLVINVGDIPYQRIDDPDSGEFLGGYAAPFA